MKEEKRTKTGELKHGEIVHKRQWEGDSSMYLEYQLMESVCKRPSYGVTLN